MSKRVIRRGSDRQPGAETLGGRSQAMTPILVFSLAFALFFVGPALLGSTFRPYPLMKNGDVFDLLTPLFLIPLYWQLWARAGQRPAAQVANTVFLVLAALWTLGQGMHLSANSIGHQLSTMKASPAYQLTDFYDETLSHYLWHLGIFGLTALIMVRSWRGVVQVTPSSRWQLVAALCIYGLTFAVITLEGTTWPLGLPFAAAAGSAPLILGRDRLDGRPALAFFSWAHLLALFILAGWWLYWGSMVEPCSVIGC
jgi:hypothetical protein